jgi:Na+/H+-dicarboxylate symporter
MIATLISFVVRLAVLGVFAFLFIVLYEHGPSDYLANLTQEFNALVAAANTAMEPVPLPAASGGK